MGLFASCYFWYAETMNDELKLALYNIKGWLIGIVVLLSVQSCVLAYVLYRP
jgi:hypothetical protein